MPIPDFDELFDVVGTYHNLIFDFGDTITNTTGGANAVIDELVAAGVRNKVGGLISSADNSQAQIRAAISSIYAQLQAFLTDRVYIYENLPVVNFSFDEIMDEIYKDMVDQIKTIDESIVLLDAADVDDTIIYHEDSTEDPTEDKLRLFVTRILDGTTSPGNSASPKDYYSGEPSQLAIACNVHAKCISAVTAGSESFRLISDAERTGPYDANSEQSGPGPIINNGQQINIIPDNPLFNTYTTTDIPDGWIIVGGTPGVDFGDYVLGAGGSGGLEIATSGAGTLFGQTISNFSKSKMYCAYLRCISNQNPTGTGSMTLEILDLSLADIVPSVSVPLAISTDESDNSFVHVFFQIPEDYTDTSFLIRFEADTLTNGLHAIVKESAVVPVTYYNGLGFALAGGGTIAEVDDIYTLPVTYNGGVEKLYSALFRRGFNRQLPISRTPNITEPVPY